MFIFLKTLGNFVSIGDVLEIIALVNCKFYLGTHHQMMLHKSEVVVQCFDRYSAWNSGSKFLEYGDFALNALLNEQA